MQMGFDFWSSHAQNQEEYFDDQCIPIWVQVDRIARSRYVKCNKIDLNSTI